MARFLEELVCTQETEARLAQFAGTALLRLYGRVRVGDARRSKFEPILDLDPKGTNGTVEGATSEHKTAKAGSGLTLPLVAPAFGVGRSVSAASVGREHGLVAVASCSWTRRPKARRCLRARPSVASQTSR